MNLYELNEPHGVPPCHREHYRTALGDGKVLTLLAEDDGQVVGTFGLQHSFEPGVSWLCYLLVRPDCHHRGIGTTMFFAALALMAENSADRVLVIQSLPGAAEFYYRFGFRRFREVLFADGQMHPIAVLSVTSAMIIGCRDWLAAAGARLPEGAWEIPTAVGP